MRWRTAILLALLVLPAAAHGACTGDCDDDKAVSIDELITLVNVALGNVSVDVCPYGDRDHDRVIAIDELVRAVGHAVEACEDDLEPLPWKHRLAHPSDPYLAFASEGPAWVKFTIRVGDPTRVYFQNSAQFRFHQEFVSAALPPYIGWTPAEIDAVSLHAEGQELVFGAVLYSPNTPHEVGIQLVRQDAYALEEVIAYFTAVRAAVDAAGGTPFLYFPTFEQQPSAAQQRDALQAAGIPLGSTARWMRGDACYNMGWAHGRLVYVAGDGIDAAYAAGDLTPADILLTDGVPAEIPFVAGVLSLAPSTPSSHVALLAGDWEIPFAFLAQADSVAAAEALVGREVVLRATTRSPLVFTGEESDSAACQVRLVDVTGALDAAVVAHLRDLKRAPDLAIRPFVHSGTYIAEVDTATPDDIVRIGGKAANYGFLRRAIPANARFGIAVTFDLWDEYLDQPIDGGPTLRARIAALLAPFPTYPPADFEALFAALDDARDLIDDVADFTPAQRAAILAALDRFEPTLPIRFRSSTNVEDSDVFTGAGLYESESGCLADELDDDDEGPSRCDASRPTERGVFRALRKVYQSFYNDNAYLERLRHRVDESTVGMAVLVHHSFPDPTELANGVATLRVTAPNTASLSIVSQPGALSVTNPEEAGVPEVVEVFAFGSSVIPSQRQGSDHLPLGATVLDMPQEYVALSRLLLAVGAAFGDFHGEQQFSIEFEYKKIVGEGLDVKQVRRIPGLTGTATPPVLIDTPVELCTFQGEAADVFANYRLKSRWRPTLINGPVGDASLYAAAPHRFVLDDAVQELHGAPATWRDAAHETFVPEFTPGVRGFRQIWTVGEGVRRRTMRLETLVPESIGPARLPILFADDLGYDLVARFASQVPYIDYLSEPALRDEEIVRLVVCLDQRPLSEGHALQQRDLGDGDIAVTSDFYWPPNPVGSVAGYTAPLDRWLGTTIAGLNSQPLTLTGYFSQTYRPGHHNFSESFLFDPRLEDGIPPAVVAEWDALGLQALIPRTGFPPQEPAMLALTRDGRIVDAAEILGD